MSPSVSNKIFELLENDDDEAVQRLIEEGKAEKYNSRDFTKEMGKDLQQDHDILLEIKKLWMQVKRDPKLKKTIRELSGEKVLKDNHLIVFTESKETANYLFQNINTHIPLKLLESHYAEQNPAVSGKREVILSLYLWGEEDDK